MRCRLCKYMWGLIRCRMCGYIWGINAMQAVRGYWGVIRGMLSKNKRDMYIAVELPGRPKLVETKYDSVQF